jgi:hypothetical protein
LKIFLDTADIDAIIRANITGVLDGVAINPTRIMATGRILRGQHKNQA